MNQRARHLIDSLNLQPHPEGGHYRELFRDSQTVTPGDGRAERAALTLIYFLLAEGERSAWHRVASTELWHFVEGAPLTLQTLHGAQTLGPLDGSGATPYIVVPAGAWQAAVSDGAYTLVCCTVAPGFDFADFVLHPADTEPRP